MLDWMLDRIREPSTHVALAGLLSAAGLGWADEGTVREILLGVSAVLLVVGVGKREQGRR
tara:strand:- start:644 stop:823 length:180 start_codon:yes stop_codon:yes gene_type:complete